MLSHGDWFIHSWKWEPGGTWWLCVWVQICAFNVSMRYMLLWELRWVLDWSRSVSGIIILYIAWEQGYPVLALYKHTLLTWWPRNFYQYYSTSQKSYSVNTKSHYITLNISLYIKYGKDTSKRKSCCYWIKYLLQNKINSVV